jgi:hypothetical protein
MQQGVRVATKLLAAVVGLLIVAAVVGATIRVLHVYVANWKFSQAISTQARIISVRNGSTVRLVDAIDQAAQRQGIRIKPADIKVEPGPEETRVSADYAAPIDLYFFQANLQIHVQYPEKKEFLSPFHRFGLSAAGLLFGIYWFFAGFALYWEFRLISDTPLAPIRGVAMGLVQIRGKAFGGRTLTAPVTQQPCFLYKVDIDRRSSGRGGSGRWTPCMTDTVGVKFFLQDETGRVLIDPQDADLDLREICKSEVSNNEHLLLGQGWKTEENPVSGPGLPVPQSELRRYIREVESGVDTGLSRGKDIPAHGFAKPRRTKTSRGISYFVSQILDAGLAPAKGTLSMDYSHSPGDYRLTEYCIVPEETYDVTGTCAVNPEAQDGPDRQIVRKGENAPMFLISDKTGNDLMLTLRARARLRIFGGGLLAVGSAAALLETLGFLF